MSVLYILIPLSLVMGVGALVSFVWATKSGQWDDLDRQGNEILGEERRMKGHGDES